MRQSRQSIAGQPSDPLLLSTSTGHGLIGASLLSLEVEDTSPQRTLAQAWPLLLTLLPFHFLIVTPLFDFFSSASPTRVGIMPTRPAILWCLEVYTIVFVGYFAPNLVDLICILFLTEACLTQSQMRQNLRQRSGVLHYSDQS
jgi:hypothetical protein